MNVNIAEKIDNKVIPFMVINGQGKSSDDNSHHKRKGVSSEVYPFRTAEEISSIIEVLNARISQADKPEQEQIAYRNKLMVLLGMNLAVRASDLRLLKWNFFFDGDMSIKEFYHFQPLKQQKSGKFVKLFFNQTVKKAIDDYLKIYPITKAELNEYIFASRKGEEPVTARTIHRIVKGIAEEAGIKQNIGSHSLRKTWGYNVWHNAKNKTEALVLLQKCFGHSSSVVTMKYIGITDNEIKNIYESVEIGLDYL